MHSQGPNRISLSLASPGVIAMLLSGCESREDRLDRLTLERSNTVTARLALRATWYSHNTASGNSSSTIIGLRRASNQDRCRALSSFAAAQAMFHQVVVIQDGVDRVDRGQLRADEVLPQLLPYVRRPPSRVLALQSNDRGFNRRRQPIRLPVRAVAAIAEGLGPEIFVAVVDVVARLARNPELRAQRRQFSRPRAGGRQTVWLRKDIMDAREGCPPEL